MVVMWWEVTVVVPGLVMKRSLNFRIVATRLHIFGKLVVHLFIIVHVGLHSLQSSPRCSSLPCQLDTTSLQRYPIFPNCTEYFGIVLGCRYTYMRFALHLCHCDWHGGQNLGLFHAFDVPNVAGVIRLANPLGSCATSRAP